MSEILSIIDVNNYGIQSMVAGGADLQEKTATPTTSQQVIQADEGYDGLSSVTVNAVTSAIDENIIPTNIRTGKTILGVQGNLEPDKPDQNKTVTPSTSQQTVRADTGYELAQVTVEAMNLQSKDVTINQNGTTTVTADQGYDGLSDVDVTVSGILDTSDATATEEDIVNPKTAYVNGVKLSGQLRKSSSLTFTDLERIQIVGNRLNLSGLTTTRTLLDANRNVNFRPLLSDVAPVIGAEASKIKKDEVICGVTGTYEGTKAVLPDGIKFRNSTATDFSWLTNVDISNVIIMDGMFTNCSNLTTMPQLDTSNVTNMTNMFVRCSNLTTIPQLDTSNVTSMSNMFTSCASLSNESLNNILAMCANATAYIQQGTYMTLKYIGLSQTQAETCQTLSNWNDFVTAGWSSGYTS